MKLIMKILNSLFFVIFLLSAAVQYNDPDPFLWIMLYLAGAIVCLMAIFGKFNVPATLVLLFVYLGYSIFLLFSDNGVLSWIFEHGGENIVQSMHAEKPWIEETREFFGLIILILAVGLNLFFFRNKLSFFSPKAGKVSS